MSIFPTRIFLATDGSKEAGLAARSAAELADKTGSELHVVHVLALPLDTHDPSSLEPEVRQRLETRARRSLEEEMGRIEALGGAVEGSHLRVGRPDAEILALAEEINAGLIVMGSRGVGGVRRALVGSVSDSVVRHAHCPVLMVRGEPVFSPTQVLLATDGSQDAELAATTAIDLSKRLDAELHTVYVEPMPERHSSRSMRFPVDLPAEVVESVEQEAKIKLEEQLQKIKQAGEVAHAHPRVGVPPAEIVALAEEIGAGLIVMGSRGLGGIRRTLIGSVSDSVVRHAHCPVLVVRGEHGE